MRRLILATIRNNLNTLKEADIWNFILFALFKVKEIPEYSSLSELVYILNKTELLKLCEYFGGQTLTIPTIEELETMLYGLLIYQLVEVEKLSFDDALESISLSALNVKKIKNSYLKIKTVLNNYELTSRGSV